MIAIEVGMGALPLGSPMVAASRIAATGAVRVGLPWRAQGNLNR
jgi:hypothetical protein